jgi:hypothetical protein
VLAAIQGDDIIVMLVGGDKDLGNENRAMGQEAEARTAGTTDSPKHRMKSSPAKRTAVVGYLREPGPAEGQDA